jgi:hypothetical protein
MINYAKLQQELCNPDANLGAYESIVEDIIAMEKISLQANILLGYSTALLENESRLTRAQSLLFTIRLRILKSL